MRVVAMLAMLAVLGASTAVAQDKAENNPPLQIYVDTAGVSRMAPDTYITWVFAKAGPNTWPSSGLIVGFDCKNRKVRRLAHVVYQLRPDGLGVTGDIVEDDLPWVDVKYPEMLRIVCEVGKNHNDALQEPVVPREQFMDPNTRTT